MGERKTTDGITPYDVNGFGTEHTYVAGTTIIDDIALTPDTNHVPGDTDEAINEISISRWFRDDGSTTT